MAGDYMSEETHLFQPSEDWQIDGCVSAPSGWDVQVNAMQKGSCLFVRRY